MQITSYEFVYDSSNLDIKKDILASMYSNNFVWDISFLIIVLFLLIIACLSIGMPYIMWYFLEKKEQKQKDEKKNTIKELILMKEIQIELEREIEQSLLNAWLKITKNEDI